MPDIGEFKTIKGRKCVWTGSYWRFADLPPEDERERRNEDGRRLVQWMNANSGRTGRWTMIGN